MAGLTRHAVSLRDGDALGAVKTVVGPHHLTEIVPERALVLPRPRDPVDEKQYTGDVTRLKQPFDEGHRGAGLPVPVAISTSKLAASAAQERWSMDFMCDPAGNCTCAPF